MDPMRALASLEFVSARGLDTSDQGPTILANQVNAPKKRWLFVVIMRWIVMRWKIMISLGNGRWSWWRVMVVIMMLLMYSELLLQIMISLGNGWWSWWRRGASLFWTWRSKGGNGRRSSSFIFTVFIVFFILIIIDIIDIMTSWSDSKQCCGRVSKDLGEHMSDSWGLPVPEVVMLFVKMMILEVVMMFMMTMMMMIMMFMMLYLDKWQYKVH